MEIFYSLSPKKGVVLALGFFDGVHIAHQKLIKKAIDIAGQNKTKTALLTFSKAPFAVLFNKEAKYIEPLKQKILNIEKLGVDYLYILNFEDFKNIEASDYLQIIIENFAPKGVVTGFNHTFGKNRKGNSALLAQTDKFEYFEIEPVKLNNEIISSTNIKNAIENGEIEKANLMLGRMFSFEGRVIKGAQIARKLGFKTANVLWKKDIVKPEYGVYSGFCTVNNKKYKAMINFGLRPSVDKNLKETLEVHIIDFEQNIYNKTIRVYFEHKIRNEIKFSSLEELKAQIEKDYKIIIVQTSTKTE